MPGATPLGLAGALILCGGRHRLDGVDKAELGTVAHSTVEGQPPSRQRVQQVFAPQGGAEPLRSKKVARGPTDQPSNSRRPAVGANPSFPTMDVMILAHLKDRPAPRPEHSSHVPDVLTGDARVRHVLEHDERIHDVSCGVWDPAEITAAAQEDTYIVKATERLTASIDHLG